MVLSSPVLGSVIVVGKTSGGTLYQYKTWTEGKLIRKLTVYETGDRMIGIKLWKSGETDNRGTVYGTASGTASTFAFEDGEIITSMTLWQGKWQTVGDRAGRISFKTNKGRSFDHGYPHSSTASGGTRIDVHSGLLVGVEVRAGEDINCWGFAFLLPIQNCQLQNVSYVDVSVLGGLSLETLDSLKSKNDSSVDVVYALQGKKEKTITSSWSKTDSITLSLSMTVNAGIPSINVGAEASAGWEVGSSSTYGESFTSERTISWSIGNTLKPGRWVTRQVFCYAGKINVPYNGTMVVTVNTGSTFSFAVSGRYDGVSVTEYIVRGADSEEPVERIIRL